MGSPKNAMLKNLGGVRQAGARRIVADLHNLSTEVVQKKKDRKLKKERRRRGRP